MSLPPLDAVIKTIVRTGKVVLGSRRTLKLVKLGKVKAVIVASNLPRDLREDLEYYAKLSEVPVIVFPGTNTELGVACGKPFSVAMMGVVDPGQVPLDILMAYASKR